MTSDLFYRNPRLMVLTVALILVGGLSSYYVLPRMEDPLLTERAAMVVTRFPGADAERVESLVTEKLEQELQEIDEIKEVRSLSRSGVSTVNIELRDDIYEVDTVWSRIRDKLDDARPALPDGALEPVFEQLDVKAYALIAALTWNPASGTDEDVEPTPNYAILRRLAEQLDDELLAISGTEEVDTFGDPEEEVVVEVDQAKLAALGLTVQSVSDQLRASDSKISAGRFRSRDDLLLEVSGEFESLERIGRVPISYGTDSNGTEGRFVRLLDVATIRKGVMEPPSSLALVHGKPAIALGALVRPSVRIDHWSAEVDNTLSEFRDALPRGIELHTIFQQNDYVETRLAGLLGNLVLGGIAVISVILVMMGWRSAIIVGTALPLSALMVLTGMRMLEIPIHQMSVTGLIIALGLLIDNAIVIVDEVNERLRHTDSPARAVSSSVGHLALPLLGSTVTTALAFAPIALMPGPAGEFVGSIAVSVIMAIVSSLFLALTVVPAITALTARLGPDGASDNHPRGDRLKIRPTWWKEGLHLPRLLAGYRRGLRAMFSRPAIGIAAGVALPLIGFLQFSKLPEQFFPPADRDQFQIELELPSTTSVSETLETANRMRNQLLRHEDVQEVSWFLGESAPSFYYNVIPRRRDTSSYAQAMVQLTTGKEPMSVIRQLQGELDQAFPESRVLVRQLEQGPPFDAPIEVRLFGPDLQVLRSLGDQVRKAMSDSANVVHTRADLGETVPKLSLSVHEDEARLAGLDHSGIANQLSSTLEGAVGGSILEQTEELPVRVRVSNQQRGEVRSIASLELLGPTMSDTSHNGVPLSALASISLEPQSASIPRFNQRRMNEVQAYITAGVLPDTVLAEVQERLEQSSFELPPGYTMQLGGEAAKRDDAVGNLMVNVGILMVLMVATLVLSFSSFRMAGIIGVVAFLSAGLGVGALWVFGYPFGFMAIVGTMGLVGVAINDTIVVLAAIRDDEQARQGSPVAVAEVVVRSTRHVVATSLTTIAGFVPLLVGGGGFWPPLAVSIAGGVGGATILALFFAPSAYILAMCRSCKTAQSAEPEWLVHEPQRSIGKVRVQPAVMATSR